VTKLLAGICLALALAGCSAPPSELERYKAECQNRGGFMSMIKGAGWSESATFRCIEANPRLEDFQP